MTRLTVRLLTIALAAALLACSPAGGQTLTGTFQFGKYKATRKGRPATGTFFRMIYPKGSVKKGPFFANADSKVKNKTYTVLKPGIDGGLRTGAFQDPPTPSFAPNGFALSNRIMTPTLFAGIKFGLSTAAKDMQSGTTVGVPVVKRSGPKLTGDLRGFTASWNSIWFNQGSPKPGGNLPGLTRPVKGTYDPKTRHYVITWVSQIVGGPFNDFAGYWHLEGKFKPRG